MDNKERLGNRMYGLALLALGGGIPITMALTCGSNLIVNGCGTLVAAEGVGDLISGERGYLSSRMAEYFDERSKIDYRK
jgi:hypothetical protein